MRAPSAQLDQQVRNFFAAYTGGQATTAYAMLSQRCRATLTRAAFAAQVADVHQSYGTATIESLEVTVNGDLGFVSVRSTAAALDTTRQPWDLESGHWHNDDC